MAERIRDLILAAPGDELSDVGELLLMFAARAEHLHALIRPALQRGVTVVCDRFTDATFAYQGGGRGVDPHKVRVLQALVQGDLVPDLTLLLDASPELSAQRIAGRGWRDRFESERHEFFARVRQAYLDIAASEPARVRIIDAAEPLAKVQAAIAHNLENFYEK